MWKQTLAKKKKKKHDRKNMLKLKIAIHDCKNKFMLKISYTINCI